MEKTAVIAIRDSLKNQDKPNLRIIFDNGVNLSITSDQIIWDDDKEIIIGFMADGSSGAFAAGLPIRTICSTYENIQFLMGNTDVKNLGNMITSLKSSVTITSDDEKRITEYFRKVFDPNLDLSHKAYLAHDIKRD